MFKNYLDDRIGRIYEEQEEFSRWTIRSIRLEFLALGNWRPFSKIRKARKRAGLGGNTSIKPWGFQCEKGIDSPWVACLEFHRSFREEESGARGRGKEEAK